MKHLCIHEYHTIFLYFPQVASSGHLPLFLYEKDVALMSKWIKAEPNASAENLLALIHSVFKLDSSENPISVSYNVYT